MPDKPTKITDEQMPEYVRRCWHLYQSATQDIREASEESKRMWLGGKHQWREGEISARVANNLPWVSINRLKPACDQVENEARNNPPGPQIHPVGPGADKDGAQIQEGLIREYEYRCDAQDAYVTALKLAASGNYGAFEMGTEFAGRRTMQQRIIVKRIEDPESLFVDPDARGACREDAGWAGRIRVYSREKLIEEHGSRLKVLNRNLVDRSAGWMQSAVNWHGNQSSINQWVGGYKSEGPYYIAEFYRVTVEEKQLTLYSDNLLRYDDEPAPKGVKPEEDKTGATIRRVDPVRVVTKHLVTALDHLKKTPWLGDQIPIFWVLGPEMWIKGKLYRLSLIDGAIESQRGLNFAATAAVETVGAMTKSPWIGYVGQFDVANAQGQNPWLDSNIKRYAYMEVKPVYAVNPATSLSELLPPPQRNAWEAPIARVLELCQFFGEQIKAATSVFFDPAVQSVRDVQSGEAIKALQSQTNIGTLNWQDALHRAVAQSYRQAGQVMRRIMSQQMVVTVVRADTLHETKEINREFPARPELGIPAGVDPETKKKGQRNSITDGEYAYRVTAGPNFRTRSEQALENFMEVLKIAPAITSVPGVLSQVIRMVGEGNPEMEQMADSLLPEGANDQDATPQQLQQKIVMMAQQNQQLMQALQQMHQAIQAKLPQVEAQKFKTLFDGLIKLETARITASKDRDLADSDRVGALLETSLNLAHETAAQAAEHEHEESMADQAHRNATDLATTNAALQPQPQETTQ